MEQTGTKQSGAKLVAGAYILLSLAAIGFGLPEMFSFGVAQWIVLIVAIVFSLVAALSPLRLFRSDSFFILREPSLIWSIIWLGTGGAMVVAVATCFLNYRAHGRDLARKIAESCVTVLATFTAGKALYLVLDVSGGSSSYPIANSPVGVGYLTAAIAVGSIVYILTTLALTLIFFKVEGSIEPAIGFRVNVFYILISPFIVSISVLFFQLIVSHLGILIGAAALPIAIAAHFAYRFHRQKLAQKTKELREASRIHVATVEALATAIDARDQVGGGHVSRTQIYAIGIGKVLGLPSEEIQALRTGALLHDIGKLAVPDHILNKPGKLTPAEFEKMKIHPEVGASILDIIDFPYPVVPTIRHHHEAWDGSGYPLGLKKEEIPLTARILAVADAYDTLRGARPYRPPVSREDARRYIMNSAGKQFDPRIVDVFVRNLSKFDERIESKQLQYNADKTVDILNERADKGSAGYVEQIKRANREVYTLYELARVFSSSQSIDETLSLFVKKIEDLVPFDTCVVYLLDDSESFAIAKYAEGKNAEKLLNRRVAVGQGATGYTLKTRQPVYHVNPGLDFSFYHMEFISDYTSMASLPLIAQEKLVGAVSIYSCALEAYEDEHMRLLETLARIASDAISSSLKHAETETRAYTDAMTGLPNARSLQIQFDKEVARARRNNSNFQLLMLDLDGFKAVNDTHGHKAGDRLLKEISAVMRKLLRDYDFLARYAGDEFVAIIPDTPPEVVNELCLRMEQAVKNYKLEVGNGAYASVGVSLGASTFPTAGDTLDKLIIAADKVMYAVKGRRKAQERSRKMAEFEAAKRLDRELRETEERIRNPIISDVQAILAIDTPDVIFELDETHVVPSGKPKPHPNR